MISVLVVDDSEELRRALETLIRASGVFDVVALAADGAEAVALVETHEPDVVLMDIKMPVMDGIEATRLIRSRSPGVAVVAHTAYDEAELVADMVKAGARGYLVKGVGADDLFDGLRSATEGGARMSVSAVGSLFDEVVHATRDSRGAEAEIDVLATIAEDRRRCDGVTGLLDRTHFYRALQGDVAGGLPVSVAVVRVVDLDEMNRLFGWEMGDAVLAALSRALRDMAEVQWSLGRLDGDELAVTLPGFDRSTARRLAARLCRLPANLDSVAEKRIRLQIGMATLTGGNDDACSLLEGARGAARAAKPGTYVDIEMLAPIDSGQMERVDALVGALCPEIEVARMVQDVGVLAAVLCDACGRAEAISLARSAGTLCALLGVFRAGTVAALVTAADVRFEDLRLVTAIAGSESAGVVGDVLAGADAHVGSLQFASEAVAIALRYTAAVERGSDPESALHEVTTWAGHRFDPRLLEALAISQHRGDDQASDLGDDV